MSSLPSDLYYGLEGLKTVRANSLGHIGGLFMLSPNSFALMVIDPRQVPCRACNAQRGKPCVYIQDRSGHGAGVGNEMVGYHLLRELDAP